MRDRESTDTRRDSQDLSATLAVPRRDPGGTLATLSFGSPRESRDLRPDLRPRNKCSIVYKKNASLLLSQTLGP